MKQLRRIGWMLLICMVWVLASCCAFAQEPETYTCGYVDYILLEDGTACITRCFGPDADFAIPAEVDGHKVTQLADKLLYGNRWITGVTIPDTVTTIGKLAFTDCISLSRSTVRLAGAMPSRRSSFRTAWRSLAISALRCASILRISPCRTA